MELYVNVNGELVYLNSFCGQIKAMHCTWLCLSVAVEDKLICSGLGITIRDFL
jgi:hypothetical protein